MPQWVKINLGSEHMTGEHPDLTFLTQNHAALMLEPDGNQTLTPVRLIRAPSLPRQTVITSSMQSASLAVTFAPPPHPLLGGLAWSLLSFITI